MAKTEAHEETQVTKDKLRSFKGTPDKKAYSLKTDMPEGEKAPKDRGETHMGGVHKGGDAESAHMGHHGMSHARKHLEKETERGEHVAEVGGHAIHEHSGRHGHK